MEISIIPESGEGYQFDYEKKVWKELRAIELGIK